MNENSLKLAFGSLLHDFGKLLYRYNDGRNHSVSGYEYLKEKTKLGEYKDILNCIKYHHSSLLGKADVNTDDLCYITYIADNIASATDRRTNESETTGFVRDISSETVFNILNGNNQKKVHIPSVLSKESGINYPTDNNISFDESFYGKIVSDITDLLKGIEIEERYVNSLLQVLESTLTYIPSSTQTGELRDISLYDHLKLTAAFSLCIKEYLESNHITDYNEELYKNAEKFYDKKAFCIYSIDVSGIHQFIYNISSTKGTLKSLRARSFYLEMLMEHSIDELLSRLGLSRANVLYTGGGHTYIIVPATEKTLNLIDEFESELNEWLITTFGNALYAAGGYALCSANELKNKPQGSYKQIFKTISTAISAKKLKRYKALDIALLNSNNKTNDHSRECSVCHRSDLLTDESECTICSGLKNLANDIIGNNGFFVILKSSKAPNTVSMPFGCVLTAADEKQMLEIINSPEYIRSYSKNKGYTGVNVMTNLWVGDYASKKEFEKLAENTEGIKRIAVLRADIDNMGQAFVNGFEDKYKTISRTATLSRKLSLYFKLHISTLLENGSFELYKDKVNHKRNAVIVYSGGDDLFIVGGWDDIICFAVDLYNSFKHFSQNTLTVSAGVGIFPHKYPISAMAELVGELEECSKKYKNETKNAVTLFDETGTYSWEELIDDVIGQKLRAIQSFIDDNDEKGKALLYKMLELIRDKREDRLNIARFAYLLARIKPVGDNVPLEEIDRYNQFAKSMYRWIQNEEECRKLTTAIYIYVYMHRESEDK